MLIEEEGGNGIIKNTYWSKKRQEGREEKERTIGQTGETSTERIVRWSI